MTYGSQMLDVRSWLNANMDSKSLHVMNLLLLDPIASSAEDEIDQGVYGVIVLFRA
jgi:hypothetical protein